MEVTIEKPTTLQRYPAYKDSGVEWLGEIPEHWKVIRLKNIIRANITDGPHETPVFIDEGIPFLSVDGIQEGELVFENCRYISVKDFTKYKKKCNIEKYDILMGKAASIGKIAQSKVDFEYSIWSPLALIKPLLSKINSTFLEFYLKSSYSQYQIEILCTSNTQKNISMGDIPKIISTLPPLEEQTAIANFLDDKTTKIDQAIAIKQKQIELLKEHRQILIHNAVTRGLNDNVKLKDSGVEWIGEIPEHWKIKRAKYLFDEINDRSQTGDEELLSVSHMTGVTPRSEKNVSMFKAEDYTGSKLCISGDLIYNIMWAWMGALGISDRVGIVSPSYAVYRQKDPNSFNLWYIELLLGGLNYIAHYNRVSTGLHSSRLRFYSTMFFEMPIAFPTKKEQDEIIDFLKTTTAKIATAISLKEQEIDKLKEYKMSLIDGVVTGKVKVV
jgi:type I restriction enzyme S subunit